MVLIEIISPVLLNPHSGPDRGHSPEEWGDFLFVCPSTYPFVHPFVSHLEALGLACQTQGLACQAQGPASQAQGPASQA